MSNPNQANINTYLLGTYSTNLTATLTTVIGNVANSNGVLKVNSILFNNYSATLNSNITLRLNKFNAGNVNLHNKLAVPANSRNYFLNRNAFLVLNEGDSLSANTDANNANVAITIGYEEVSERNSTFIEYLVVAGGGGGGSSGPYNSGSGGGGAGGLLYGIQSGIQLGTCYVLTVGAGGAGGVSSNGINGSNSIFASPSSNLLVSVGGGGGASSSCSGVGCPGGSGGGGGNGGTGGQGFPGQGFRGGNATNNVAPFSDDPGGGGGGAGEAALDTSGNAATKGGNGCLLDITGTSQYYAGGGGGGAHACYGQGVGAGGCGGGGPGSSGAPATPGTGTTGGGGGGSGQSAPGPAGYTAGSGGSGTIILRQPIFKQIATTTGNVTVSSSGVYRIYQFNGSGSITF